MPPLRAPRLSELLAAGLGCLMANMACQNSLLPSSGVPGNEAPLASYRDSLLDLDMEYPEGWAPEVEKTYGLNAVTWNVYFEPPQTLSTRRFTVKIIEPAFPDTQRTLEAFKAEFLARLLSGHGDVRLVDSGHVDLGGEPGFQAEYLSYLDGKPHVRFLEIICLRPPGPPGPTGRARSGRDFSLSFEAAESTAEEDMLLFARVADRFRFYSP